MDQRILIIATLCTVLAAADYDARIENTNFLQHYRHAPTQYGFDYDRVRLCGDATSGRFFVSGIADGVGYAGEAFLQSAAFMALDRQRADIPFDVRTRTWSDNGLAGHLRLHRLFGGFEDDVQRITVGIQRVSMGVGRIWTPTDLFNPPNPYALEPDEVFGVLALQHAYAIGELSTLQTIVSLRRNRTLKYAMRLKGYVLFADVGIDLMHSDATDLIGWEIEGNLLKSGAEWRSEGGWIRSDDLDTALFQGILGVDYGFENGVTWTVEGRYGSKTFEAETIAALASSEVAGSLSPARLHLGTSLYYDLSLALSGTLLYVESVADPGSRFVLPSLAYTPDDHHTIAVGAVLGGGAGEFAAYGQSVYLKWTLVY